jgi:alpha-L-fucosidase 2
MCNPSLEQPTLKDTLWYAQPASQWMEALPVGNGRIGAMVFGNPTKERIQLNEDSMWPGGPDFGDSKGNAADLEYIRNLIVQGKVHEADQEIVDRFSFKAITRSHQTLGDLHLEFKIDSSKISEYNRLLSMDQAIVTTRYKLSGYDCTLSTFASAPDDVIVTHIKTDHPEGLDFDIRLDRPDDHGHPTVVVTNPSDTEISMQGTVTQHGGKKLSEPYPLDYGVKFEARLKVKTKKGEVTTDNGILKLKNIKDATIYLVANTSFYHEDYILINKETLDNLESKTLKKVQEDHIIDFSDLYNRVKLDLGGNALDSIPTDSRLDKVKNGENDLDLVAKMYKYGRYLLISCSRPGTNPSNLQGLWNEHIEAPWNADYHVNINLQMNYWLADVTNLSECHEPLFDFVERLIARGRKTATEQYGINRGAVIHHASDLWAPAFMRAARPYWGSWIHGGGWVVQHHWEHYRFTEDKVFLEKKGYPAMKAIAEFYLDWLVLDEDTKKWVSFPETSPENSYVASDGKPAAVSYGAAMGHQIIAEVFENVLAAAKVLGISDAFISEVADKRKNLTSGIKIGQDGRILEWNEHLEEYEKGHRHMSHMYALHPGDEITQQNPEAFAAAKKTIAYRLEHGGAKTGWSRAWMINFNARLLDGQAAEENIGKFLQLSTADNLFDMHPPFQIDGNFGITAGVTELLVQSHEGLINILPALPPGWANGRVQGIKARGNIELDIHWKDGNLLEIKLLSPLEKTVKVKYKDRQVDILLTKQEPISLNQNLETVG